MLQPITRGWLRCLVFTVKGLSCHPSLSTANDLDYVDMEHWIWLPVWLSLNPSGVWGALPVVLSGLGSHGSRHRSVLRFRIQHLLFVQLLLWLQQTHALLSLILSAASQLLSALPYLFLVLALLGSPNFNGLPTIPCQQTEFLAWTPVQMHLYSNSCDM